MISLAAAMEEVSKAGFVLAEMDDKQAGMLVTTLGAIQGCGEAIIDLAKIRLEEPMLYSI